MALTKQDIDRAAPREKEWSLWDDGTGAVPGLCCRIWPNGSKRWYLKTRERGRQRWFAIGRHGAPWTVKTARREALRILGDLAEGKPVAAVRDRDKAAGTVAMLCDRYLAEHAAEHKKASSAATDERNIRNHIKPLLGTLRVVDVTRADVERFKRDVKNGKTAGEKKRGPRGSHPVTGGAGAANRCLALLSKMFNLAEVWGLRSDGSNPVRHVEKYDEHARERFLSEAEIARLGDALALAEDAGTTNLYMTAAIRLLLFTGCRLSEVLGMRWEWIDTERGTLTLPDSKTGKRVVYLNPPARALLADLPRMEGNPHVICGKLRGAALVGIAKPWETIRAAAGLEGVRLHDLRHSHASVAAAAGFGLPMIGKLLGHRRAATTARYAHLGDDPVRAASDAVGNRIANALAGGGSRPDGGGDVVELPRRRRTGKPAA